jgi:hypothetical protein
MQAWIYLSKAKSPAQSLFIMMAAAPFADARLPSIKNAQARPRFIAM